MVRALFMGTPEFAVPLLETLHDLTEVVGVYTQPDRPSGRGRKLEQSPVKRKALSFGLPVLQPRSVRSAAAQDDLRALTPDLIVVAAYGLILPQAVLEVPRQHCINVHASLLPRHRGASPIAAAILSGDRETGITLMQMEAGLDTGPIIAQRVLTIGANDTTGSLEEALSRLGADLLRETLPRWLAGAVQPQPQPEVGMTMTRLIRKEDGVIDWHEPADLIARKVRAFTPWPGASTLWQGQLLKIVKARAMAHSAEPGTVHEQGSEVLVGAGSGSVALGSVQLAGKRPMAASEFVRGHRDFLNARLGQTA